MSKFKVGDKVVLHSQTIDFLENGGFSLVPLSILLRVHTVSGLNKDTGAVFILEGKDWFNEYEFEYVHVLTEFELIMRGIDVKV